MLGTSACWRWASTSAAWRFCHSLNQSEVGSSGVGTDVRVPGGLGAPGGSGGDGGGAGAPGGAYWLRPSAVATSTFWKLGAGSPLACAAVGSMYLSAFIVPFWYRSTGLGPFHVRALGLVGVWPLASWAEAA